MSQAEIVAGRAACFAGIRTFMDPDMPPPGRPEGVDNRTESATLAGFRQAAEAAVVVIDSLDVSPTMMPGPVRWPSSIEGTDHFPVVARTEHSDPVLARAAGWLVTDRSPASLAGTGPLAGLPMAVKDVIDVAGLPTRNGTPGGAWRRPDRSAAAWSVLAAAGAVCLGKSATHEMAWGVTTPQVANPVDPARIAGGSSGGSAAAVAAGVVDAALGTDTGGSIRIPAALCGVVGIRPTLHSVSSDGVTPLAPSQDVVGPLAHDVATCAAVLEVLQGRPLAGPAVPGMRVAFPEDVGALDDPVASAWEDALATLEEVGVELVPLAATPGRLAGAVSLLTMLLESAERHAEAVQASPEGFGGEARALLTLGTELVEHRTSVARARTELHRRTARVYTEHAVHAVATPSTACIAPHRDATTVELAGQPVPVSVALTRFTSWASATGLPAISVPVPGAGMPVGVQLMAPPHAEATCLALAAAVEAGGRRKA